MAASNDIVSAQRFRNGLEVEATVAEKLRYAVHCLQNYHVLLWSGVL